MIHEDAHIIYTRPLRWWNPDTWFNAFTRVDVFHVQEDVYLIDFMAQFEMEILYVSYDYVSGDEETIYNVNVVRKVGITLDKGDVFKMEITYVP